TSRNPIPAWRNRLDPTEDADTTVTPPLDRDALDPRGLDALAARLRDLPGVRAKRSIGVVADVFGHGDWWAGPGDDGAVVAAQGHDLVVGGEAMLPAFVQADPYGAGVSAVLANVNDLSAMGATPLAIVDTVVGPIDVARQVLEGLKWAGEAYD